MPFPEDVLTEDERVVLHLHPHWRALFAPAVVVVLAVAAVVAGVVLLPSGGGGSVALAVIGGLALIAVLWLALRPFLVWRSTHYLFTDERVLLQEGVFARDRRDIPLTRINDHAMSQSVIERLFGCGTLTIESAGERGQAVLHDVPGVGQVQTKLYELVEAHHDKHSLGDGEMRNILADLNDNKPLRDPTP